jgi:hypothetical protein
MSLRELNKVIDEWLNESPIELTPLSLKQIKAIIILQEIIKIKNLERCK